MAGAEYSHAHTCLLEQHAKLVGLQGLLFAAGLVAQQKQTTTLYVPGTELITRGDREAMAGEMKDVGGPSAAQSILELLTRHIGQHGITADAEPFHVEVFNRPFNVGDLLRNVQLP